MELTFVFSRSLDEGYCVAVDLQNQTFENKESGSGSGSESGSESASQEINGGHKDYLVS